jgi:hypothetical protein
MFHVLSIVSLFLTNTYLIVSYLRNFLEFPEGYTRFTDFHGQLSDQIGQTDVLICSAFRIECSYSLIQAFC